MHLLNRQLVDKKPYNVRVDQMSVGQNDFLPNDVEPKWHLEVVDGVVNLPTDLLTDDDVRYRRQQVGQTLQQKYHFFTSSPTGTATFSTTMKNATLSIMTVLISRVSSC